MEDVMKKKDRIVLYHADCIDGFTAAWAAYKRWGTEDTEYLPVRHGEPPPNVAKREVWILDFSYKRAVLNQMLEFARSLQVIDHHKTAAVDLAGFPYATFDMERSGASMAWDMLMGLAPSGRRCGSADGFGAGARPWIVDYVEDRDLWRFALPESREVSAYIGVTPMTFFHWDRMAAEGVEEAKRAGRGVMSYVDWYVDAMKPHARLMELAGHVVPVVNAPFASVSELVGALAEGHPFAAGWYQRADQSLYYSLRSRGDFDVSVIAHGFGGGGHKNAAGFIAKERVHHDVP
jgi:hypothetical protein